MIDPNLKNEAIATSEDLALINAITYRPYKSDEVKVYKAKFIDSQITGNKRQWTPAYQENAVRAGLWTGTPVTLNHVNTYNEADNLVLGRVFHAEYKPETGETFGKFYVPNNLHSSRLFNEGVEQQKFKGVSIGAHPTNVKQANGIEVIGPSENDWISHLAIVNKPGCQTCGIVQECMDDIPLVIEEIKTTPSSCSCQLKTESVEDKEQRELGRITHEELKVDYLKLQGMVLGLQISRPTYESIAANMPPLQLRQVVKDLRTVASKKIDAPESTLDSGAKQIEKQLETLKLMRG